MTTYQSPNSSFAPPTANTYYAGQGTQALVELKTRIQGVWLAYVGYRAGKNYYELHADLAAATFHGIRAARRWLVWGFFAQMWLGSVLFLLWMKSLQGHSEDISGDMGHVIRNLLIFLVPALVAVLVQYNRNVDFALFQRRFVYRVVAPIARLVEWVPAWALYLIVFLPLFFPF